MACLEQEMESGRAAVGELPIFLLSGSLHQTSSIFLDSGYAGSQCTTISLTCLTYARMNKLTFDGQTIDSIVRNGHELYIYYLRSLGHQTPRLLGHFELPSFITLSSTTFKITVAADRYFGVLSSNEIHERVATPIFPGHTSIDDAMCNAFSESRYLLLTVDVYTMAVFGKSDLFVLFDPHCGTQGAASFAVFNSARDVARYVKAKFLGNRAQFSLSVLQFCEFTPSSEYQGTQPNNHASRFLRGDALCMETSTELDRMTHRSGCSSEDVRNESNLTSVSNIDKTIQNVRKKVRQRKRDNVSRGSSCELPLFGEAVVFVQQFLCDIRQDIQNNHAAEFERMVSQLPEFTCFCCFKFLFESQCHEAIVPSSLSDVLTIPDNGVSCISCQRRLKQGKMPELSMLNILEVDTPPDVLRKLNLVEKRFLAQVQTYMTLVVLPGGQYGERGMAIHFPCNLPAHTSLLPCSSSNVPVLCLSGSLETVVRPSKILNALSWLKANNHLYFDVANNATVWPECTKETDIDTFELPLEESGAIAIDEGCIRIKFPRCKQQPISYGDEPDSEAMAFPWLFPYGRNHMHSIRRLKLTILKYYQSRFLHRKNFFRMDISYLIVCVNHFERVTLNSIIGIYMRVGKSTKLAGDKSAVVPVIAKDVRSRTFSQFAGSSDSYMFAKRIRGTAAYWRNELYNLLARIKALGPPDLFLTFSAADTKWTQLRRILAYDAQVNERDSNLTNLMRKNPVLSAIYFERRWHYFLQCILKKSFCPLGHINDYWARVEFQNRGSPHIHLFLWIDSAPSLAKGSRAAELIDYIDKIICTDLPNDLEERQLVTSLQTHNHTSTCAKPSGSKSKCRFHYPRPECAETRLLDETTRKTGRIFYETKRCSDAININAYNPHILKIWQGNMDIQMVNGVLGVAHYVCNYVCKAEPNDLRLALKELFYQFDCSSNSISDREKMLKIGMCLLKCRQMSSQEAAFRICHLPLIYSSRQVVYLNTMSLSARVKRLKPLIEIAQLDDNSDDIFMDSFLDKYRQRPKTMETLSLYQVARQYKLKSHLSIEQKERDSDSTSKGSFTPRRTYACVRTPHFQVHSENYYYSLLLLHVPHRNENELTFTDSHSEAFFQRFDAIDISSLENERVINELMESASRLKVVKSLSNLNASHFQDGISMETASLPDDHQTEPTHMLRTSNTCSEGVTWECLRANDQLSFNEHLKQLTPDQVFALKYIQSNIVKGNKVRIFLSGEAGTGKSFLMKIIIQWFTMYYKTYDGAQSVLVAAPTGVAAVNIGGATLHSALRLPVQHGKQPELTELSGVMLKKLQFQYKNLKCLIIDEISMVSDKMLGHIHRRLCTIMNSDGLFGDVNVVVCGDFFQLKPVRGHYAFKNDYLWEAFQPIYLFQNVRQANDVTYSQLLSRARLGILNSNDISQLAGRLVEHSHLLENTDLHLFPTRRQVQIFNARKQAELNGAEIALEALDLFSSTDVASGCQVPLHLIPTDDRDSGGFSKKLLVSADTKVMLIRNLFTEYKLVNGSLGCVTSYEMDSSGLNVEAINVLFTDADVGIPFKNSTTGAIRILRSSVDYSYKGRYMTRVQFPLCPAWAVTFHKAQGLSLQSACISIGKEIFSPGQAYVGLSRITHLSGLTLESFSPQKIYPDTVVVAQEAEMMQKFLAMKHELPNRQS